MTSSFRNSLISVGSMTVPGTDCASRASSDNGGLRLPRRERGRRRGAPGGAAKGLGRAAGTEIDLASTGASGHAVGAAHLQEVHGARAVPDPRADRRAADVERHAEVDLLAAPLDRDAARVARRGVVLLADRYVRRKPHRTRGAEDHHEAGQALGIGGIGRRADPAVDHREALARDLAPLPRDPLPEAPVVVVIARSSVEVHGVAIDAQRTPERAEEHGNDVSGDTAPGT